MHDVGDCNMGWSAEKSLVKNYREFHSAWRVVSVTLPPVGWLPGTCISSRLSLCMSIVYQLVLCTVIGIHLLLLDICIAKHLCTCTPRFWSCTTVACHIWLCVLLRFGILTSRRHYTYLCSWHFINADENCEFSCMQNWQNYGVWTVAVADMFCSVEAACAPTDYNTEVISLLVFCWSYRWTPFDLHFVWW